MNQAMSSPRSVPELEAERGRILTEMLQIRSVQRGTLNEQFLDVRHKGKKNPVKRGPYYVLSYSEKGRTRSRRVRRSEVEQVKRDIANHQRLQALYGEFEALTKELGQREREAAAGQESVKKKPKSPSRKAGKSGR